MQIEDLLHIFDQIFKLKPLKGPIQFYFECFVGVMTFRVTTFDRVECLLICSYSFYNRDRSKTKISMHFVIYCFAIMLNVLLVNVEAPLRCCR